MISNSHKENTTEQLYILLLQLYLDFSKETKDMGIYNRKDT